MSPYRLTPYIHTHAKPNLIQVAHCFLVFTENAAVKIQAVFRGHKVRATMKQGDSAADAASKKAEPTSVAAANNGQTTDEPSKEELEAEFREDDKGKCCADAMSEKVTHVIRFGYYELCGFEI